RGVRLDEVLVIEADAAGAAGGADDAGGDRLADAERIANRQDDVAHFDLFTIRHLDGGQVLGVDLDHGDVGLGVAANDLGGELAAILEGILHFIGAIDDVVVGADIAVIGGNDAGADALL